jgi:type IV secretion system protein VirB9
VEIVAVPTPLPLPGQLQPPPSEVKPDKRPPTDQVDAANKAALQEPSAHGCINAVQVYPIGGRALSALRGARAGERLALQPGDTHRRLVWRHHTLVIGDTTSGSGDAKRVHVLVKPFAPGLKTNLVITTDRRFIIFSSKAPTALRWRRSPDLSRTASSRCSDRTRKPTPRRR